MDMRTSKTEPQAHVKKNKRARKLLGIAASALLAILAAWFLFSPDPIRAELAQVVEGPMQVTIDNQGQVRVHDRYVVAAPVAARLERIELHEGDSVRKGQMVALMYPLPMDPRQKEEAKARLDAARALAREASLRARRAYADLQFAMHERARVEKLVNDNYVSPQAAEKAATAEATSRAEWEAARSREQAGLADVQAAEAALIAADATGGESKREFALSSPVDGYVLKVHERSERTVPAGSPLVTIGDPGRYEIVVDVLSTDAVKIRPGQTMLLEGWGGGRTLRARVRLVEPVAFTKISALGVEEQRVNIIADPVDPLGPLGDGYRIEARIVIWQSDSAIKIPGSSLYRAGEAWRVFAMEDGRARERDVILGQRNQDDAQIISGLRPGDTVIRYPGNDMEDGMRVVPLD